ncbi:hypothetical protein FRB99_004939 [Tulasnella sp. 403]|nr:hypothetical protein FRB99_004939 [Tulasnella sp. 403]
MVKDRDATLEEKNQALLEKKLILDLIEAYAVAIKHHLRSETGINYTDLHPLVAPLYQSGSGRGPGSVESVAGLTYPASPLEERDQTPGRYQAPRRRYRGVTQPDFPATPVAAIYGTLPATQPRCSDGVDGQPLLPTSSRSLEVPQSPTKIVFSPVLLWLWNVLTFRSFRSLADVTADVKQQKKSRDTLLYSSRAHRPKVAGGGSNLPLEIVRTISEWVGTLEARGTAGSK